LNEIPRKWPWLLAGLIATGLIVAWLRPHVPSATAADLPHQAAAETKTESPASASDTDAARKQRSDALRAASPEARKRALMAAFATAFHSDTPEAARMQECRIILDELGHVATFREMLALLDEHAKAPGLRSQLLPAVFKASRQPIPELVAAAKEMSDFDKNSAIVGIAEKIQWGKLPIENYTTLDELATGIHAHAFSVTLDMDLILQGDLASKQTRFSELAALSNTLPADRRTSFDVTLAVLGRREIPALAWETLSGESSAGKSDDELRALILQRMVEKDPATAITTLMRNFPTTNADLEASIRQWYAKDPAAARQWITDVGPQLAIDDQVDRLTKLLDTL
jgi:hypothetical protein